VEGNYGEIDEQVSLSKICEEEIVDEVDTHKKFYTKQSIFKVD